MTTVAQLRKAALALPEVEAEAAVAAHPSGERLVRMGKPIGLAVPLADVNGQELNALVRAAWACRAPKRVAAALAAAEAAADGQVGDLPRAIGRPATQALAQAGWTTLEEIANHTEAELLALHGVGPKAARILSAALDDLGIRLPT